MKKKTYSPYNWRAESAPVIGVDEAGRGCLAGPVCASAVIIPNDIEISGLTDSKLLSAKRRDEFYDLIMSQCIVGVAFASVEEISELNILHASLLAMKRSVEQIFVKIKAETGTLIVDGKFKVPGIERPQIPLVKGDLRAAPVAAASVIAKVTRDRLLLEMDKEFPQYGFPQHKGYATAAHKEAIAQFGPSKVHRKTFAGVKEHC